MSKQDRQGVRKASDIEQKYDLSKLNNLDGYTNRQKEQLSKLMQTLSQFSVETNTKFEDQDEQLNALARTLSDFIAETEGKFTNKDEQLSELTKTLTDFITETEGKFTEQDKEIAELTQSLADFKEETETKFAELHPIGTVYVNLTDEDPATMFGGTWELMLSGKFVVEDETTELTQSVDICYIWKRTA